MTCSPRSLVFSKIQQRVTSIHGDLLAKTGRLCIDSRSWHNTTRVPSIHGDLLVKTGGLCIDSRMTYN